MRIKIPASDVPTIPVTNPATALPQWGDDAAKTIDTIPEAKAIAPTTLLKNKWKKAHIIATNDKEQAIIPNTMEVIALW